MQTLDGLKAVCGHLLSKGKFDYVVPREIQSDRMEGEFGVYRISTGAILFMTASDVFSVSAKRLVQHVPSLLHEIDIAKEHNYMGSNLSLIHI